jgi:hypothetical protein
VKTQLYTLTNELHVVATVLEPSLGRSQEYEKKEIMLLLYCSVISNLCFLEVRVYNVHNMYTKMNEVVGFKMYSY